MSVGKVRKILFLIPDAIFRNFEDEVVEWLDQRPEPTQAQIDLVTDQQVIANELDTEANNTMTVTKKDRLIFEINYQQENRLRALEGKAALSKVVYKSALNTLYKTL